MDMLDGWLGKIRLAELISKLPEFERNMYWRTGRRLTCRAGRCGTIGCIVEGSWSVRFIAILLRDVARVATARCEHQFSEAKFRTRMCTRREKKVWKVKENSRGVEKEISALFVIYTHWETSSF